MNKENKYSIGFRCACGYTEGKPPYSDGFRCKYGNLKYTDYDFSLIDTDFYSLLPDECDGGLERAISSIVIAGTKK